MAILSLSTDIKSLIERHAAIRYVGRAIRSHGILEYHSNCPFCGGTDRFIIRPEEGTYSCAIRDSGCDQFGDMVTFLREYCAMTFREACDEIGIEPDELGDYYSSNTSYSSWGSGPPNRTWQEHGDYVVAKAQAVLRSPIGRDALAYLRARGFTDDTILDKRLGYIPLRENGRWYDESVDKWGLTAKDIGKSKVWLPEGIVIPWYVNGRLWKIDIRRLTGLKKDEDDAKILSITGSVDCLYNHDTVKPGKPAVICESALCAISGEQEAGDLAAFVATGGSGKNKPAWVRHLEQATLTLIALDLDEPDPKTSKRPGDEGSTYWEQNLTCQVRWHPYEKDINDMLVAGIDISDWVEQGTGFYYDLVAAEAVPVTEPITEEIPVVITEAIPADVDPVFDITDETMTFNDIPAGPNLCYTCLDLGRDTAAPYESEDFMYCADHYPPLHGLNQLIHSAQEAIPAFRSAKVECWRVEDGARMRESILRGYIIEYQRESKKDSGSYQPVSLPQLPRTQCPCYSINWNKDNSQSKHPCRVRACDNGFCENHRLSYELLEIGAQLGYPEVKVPFKWKGETLHRMIRAGIGCWEDAATNTHRLQAAVDFIKHKYAGHLGELATIS